MDTTESDIPDSIVIVDDSSENAKRLRDNLVELSWIDSDFVRSSPIKVPNTLRDIKEEGKVNTIKEITRVEIIREVKDIKEKAQPALAGNAPSIAFIDFNYQGEANIKVDELESIYSEIESDWKRANTDFKKGGCICGYYFNPDAESPRVMVPATEAKVAGTGLLDISDAITSSQTIRGSEKNARKAILRAFQKWEELKTPSNPLDDIWSSTNEWFSEERERPKLEGQDSRPQEWIWPHGWPGDSRSEAFIKSLESTFNLELPDHWTDADDLSPLYESVKGLCGDNYCGEGGPQNLRMGSVLLIALLALRDTNADYHKRAKDIRPSDLLDADAKFLEEQSCEVARHTAKSLYFFLKTIFKDDPKHESSLSHPRKLTWEGGSELIKLTIDLHWKASGDDSLAGVISDEKFDLPQSPQLDRRPSNARESLAWLWSGLLWSPQGFGHPGSIMIEGTRLKITAPAN